MPIEWMIFAPHPPLLVPEIGQRMLEKVRKTEQSMKTLSGQLDGDLDGVIVISPHGFARQNKINLYKHKELQGSLERFGGAEALTFPGLPSLADDLYKGLTSKELPVSMVDEAQTKDDEALDHGAYVPLYYLTKTLRDSVGVALMTPGNVQAKMLWAAGLCIRQMLSKGDQRVGVIISGDLSHRLQPGAPAGYHPQAGEFDLKVKDILEKGELKELLNISTELIQRAGECAYKPLVLGSALADPDKINPRVLSYEAPFGVGYLVAQIL